MIRKFLLLIFSFIAFSYAKNNVLKLSELYPDQKILRGSQGGTVLTIPIPDRVKIKKAMIHIEYIPSKALVKQRSVLTAMFNGVALYQQKLDPNIDIYSYDISVPLYLIKDINKFKIFVTQHYCTDCCEDGSSPELWTEILWDKSYLKINYDYKKMNNDLLTYRDYVLDYKNFSPISIGIMTETDSDDYLTMGARISGYLGSVIKYRKIYIKRVKNINKDMDIFLIGSTDYVKQVLKIKKDIPNIFVMKNPKYPNRAIIVLNAEDKTELKNIIDSFISIPKNLLMGKSIDVSKYKKPLIDAYESPLYIPLGKKVYFSDLGYDDLKFYHPSYQYTVNFNMPPDVFMISQKKFTFHLFYNYNEAVKDSSAINIFINGKFVTALKADKTYGTLLEDVELRIPVYMLKPGKNSITIQYALQAPGGGHCQRPNGLLMQGTVFSSKSYIELPRFPHWREMAYMELFTTTAYPFSIYPDLKGTQIYIAKKSKNLVSAMYTLMAYIGEKTFVPLYNVSVVSSQGDIKKSSNVIAIGANLPKEFYKNTPIMFDDDKITLRFNAFKKIEDTLKNRLLGMKENENLQTIIKLKDDLINETILTEGRSPYGGDKTFLIITSKSDKDILKSIKNLYEPKFAGYIKGDLVIIDTKKDNVYYADVGKKYYVGHLPWFEYFMFKIGFSYPMLVLMFLIVAMTIVVVLKLLLDLRLKFKEKEWQ